LLSRLTENPYTIDKDKGCALTAGSLLGSKILVYLGLVAVLIKTRI
jgi:hypothetical protein